MVSWGYVKKVGGSLDRGNFRNIYTSRYTKFELIFIFMGNNILRKLSRRYLTVVKKNSNIFFRCFVFYLTTAVLRKRIRLSEIKYTSTFLRIREKSHKFVRPRQFQEYICPGVRNSKLILSLWTIILFRILFNDNSTAKNDKSKRNKIYINFLEDTWKKSQVSRTYLSRCTKFEPSFIFINNEEKRISEKRRKRSNIIKFVDKIIRLENISAWRIRIYNTIFNLTNFAQ